MRFSPLDIAVGNLVSGLPADPIQKHQVGTRFNAVCNDYSTAAGYPNGGGAELIYVKAGGTFLNGRLVHVDKDWTLLDVPSTAGTGRSLFVTLSSFSATNIYGWVMASGMCPVRTSVAATVGPVYVGTTGVITPTAANGKQILGASTVIAASGTVTKTAKTLNGSPVIKVNDVGGLYVGMTMSGTGLSGTIASIDPGANEITLTANSTATATVTMTGTHTGFGIVHINDPFVQGQVV